MIRKGSREVRRRNQLLNKNQFSKKKKKIMEMRVKALEVEEVAASPNLLKESRQKNLSLKRINHKSKVTEKIKHAGSARDSMTTSTRSRWTFTTGRSVLC